MVSPDGVAPSRIVGVSASVNLALHHKGQKFSGTGSPGWSRKKGHKTVVVWWWFPRDGHTLTVKDGCSTMQPTASNKFTCSLYNDSNISLKYHQK